MHMILRRFPRRVLWVLANFHWCEPFFSSRPEVFSSATTVGTTELVSFQSSQNRNCDIKCLNMPLPFCQMWPRCSSRFCPFRLYCYGWGPCCLALTQALPEDHWTGGWRTIQRAVITRQSDKTDGRALPEANKASRETGLVNAAQRGHVIGIYDGSFTCEYVKCLGEQDTPSARNARTRESPVVVLDLLFGSLT